GAGGPWRPGLFQPAGDAEDSAAEGDLRPGGRDLFETGLLGDAERPALRPVRAGAAGHGAGRGGSAGEEAEGADGAAEGGRIRPARTDRGAGRPGPRELGTLRPEAAGRRRRRRQGVTTTGTPHDGPREASPRLARVGPWSLHLVHRRAVVADGVERLAALV